MQGNRIFEAILFHHAEPMPNVIKAVFSLDVNEWQGNRTLQLRLQRFDEAEKPQYVHQAEFNKTDNGFSL